MLTCLLLPLFAQEEGSGVPQEERVYIGMVVDELEGASAGMLVRAVAPGSPAEKAGICVGDVVLQVGGRAVNSRGDLRQVVASAVRGAVLPVELLRGEERLILQVVMEPRPAAAAFRASQAESVLGADKYMYPIKLTEAIRQEIRRHRRIVREQLASLPDGLEPEFVTDELQAIRDLARDAYAGRPEWMVGRAGEIFVRFRDAEGSVVLYGANNLLTLAFYDTKGQLIFRYNLNTREERAALPPAVLQRLRALH